MNLTRYTIPCFGRGTGISSSPKNNAYYRLTDPFTLYWLKYVRDNRAKDDYYWTNLITMVTTYGLAEKGHRASVQSEVTIDDLFR